MTVTGYYGTHTEGENWFRKELIAVTITFVRAGTQRLRLRGRNI